MKILKWFFVIMVSFMCLSIQGVHAEKDSWHWPVEGKVTDFFGTREGHHYGIDIGGKVGTEVHVVEGGKVTKSYYSSSYGNVIFVKHEDGYETVYAHLHKRYVAKGDSVLEGEVIGELGNTGHSTGPHLHFEVHNGDWNYAKSNVVNPLTMLQEEKVVSVAVNQSYIVQKGDTLFSIAKHFQTTVGKLKEANDLSGEIIYVEQRLQVN